MGLSCSDSLRTALDQAFAVAEEPFPDRYAMIAPGADGNCRVLDAEGYCALHRECGEGVQPAVCRLYPRSIKPGEITEAVCSGSCERVIEMLMELPAPLSFVTVELETKSPLPPCEAADERKESRRARCMAILQQPGTPLHERILRIGAFLGITDCVDSTVLFARAQKLFRTFSVISPNLQAPAMAIAQVEDATAFAALTAEAQKKLPRMEQYLENILANHMYYVQFPYAGEGTTPRAAYYGLFAAYAMLLGGGICAAAAARAEDAAVRFVDTVAAILRYVEHTEFYHNAEICLLG